MKFIIIKEVSYTQKDRVKILTRSENFTNFYTDGRISAHTWDVTYLCSAIINTTKDWNPEDEFSIVSDTDSIQYRPKAIYASKKGFFYKNAGNKIQHLTKEETDEMLSFINSAAEYIKTIK